MSALARSSVAHTVRHFRRPRATLGWTAIVCCFYLAVAPATASAVPVAAQDAGGTHLSRRLQTCGPVVWAATTYAGVTAGVVTNDTNTLYQGWSLSGNAPDINDGSPVVLSPCALMLVAVDISAFPGGGTFSANTCLTTSGIETVLFVGTGCPTNFSALSVLAANDGATWNPDTHPCGVGSTYSYVRDVPISLGQTTVYIVAQGFSCNAGEITVSWQYTLPTPSTTPTRSRTGTGTRTPTRTPTGTASSSGTAMSTVSQTPSPSGSPSGSITAPITPSLSRSKSATSAKSGSSTQTRSNT